MSKIKGDLVLKKDMVFNESITVDGNIICKDGRFNLTVKGNINAGNINAGNINARNINAWNINARNINAGNINARNINAWNINARNINAGNINAGNINARNIDYYAVCFAYQCIECNSIKGSRDNCKHFVLDGKINSKRKVVKLRLSRELDERGFYERLFK